MAKTQKTRKKKSNAKNHVKRGKAAKKKSQKRKTKTKKSSQAPQSMEELLQKTDYRIKGWQRGDKVKGTITDISKKSVLVDIGAKTEGLVIGKELAAAQDFIQHLGQGDKIEATITSPENDKGQILLSLKDTAEEYKWNLFNQYLETEKTIKVRGLDTNKGGVIARFMGVRGFVPASQLGRKYLGKQNQLQNKEFKVKIIEVAREKNRLIFSEKQVSEAKAIAKKQKALKKIKKDKVYEGKISGVMPFGIFVHVPIGKGELFLEGLVHISEISWERVDNLKKMFKVGQKVKVKVISIDKDEGKLNLSIKRLKEDPWEKIAKKYKKDTKIKGKVSRLVGFGAFVELEPGVEGLVHISKIPADYPIKVGQEVRVYVEELDLEKRRMSLGLVLKEKPVGYK